MIASLWGSTLFHCCHTDSNNLTYFMEGLIVTMTGDPRTLGVVQALFHYQNPFSRGVLVAWPFLFLVFAF